MEMLKEESSSRNGRKDSYTDGHLTTPLPYRTEACSGTVSLANMQRFQADSTSASESRQRSVSRIRHSSAASSIVGRRRKQQERG